MKRLVDLFNMVIKKHKKLKKWQRIVTILAAMITFVTTYALILPAITVEKDKTDLVSGMYLEEDVEYLSDAELPEKVEEDETTYAPTVGTLTASGNDYTVKLTYDGTSGVPADARLEVSEIARDSEVYKTYLEEAKKAMGLTEEESLPRYAARFFDIKIMVGEDEFTPETGVTVEIAYTEPLAVEPETEVSAVHFQEDVSEPEVIYASATEVAEDGTATVEFQAESFSVYGVIYTVDYHWEVDGKVYDFSIPGGGFVSFTDLVEVLGIADDTALTLGDVEISEAARKFVADVASVEFSTPTLVDVSKVEADVTVGQIKESRGLECEYSAELTEEQIAEINAQTVRAGDWAMINMLPFTTEETLTVTMTNGEVFVIKVTDAQISTRVITADGEDFIITVTYDEDAQIPEDAVLEADEIVPGTKEYEDYLEQAWVAICDENSQETEEVAPDKSADTAEESADAEKESAEDKHISFARFFDIRIMAGGEKIEPAAPVKVTVTYANALDVAKYSVLYAVHFGENGTEVIDPSSAQDNKSVIFMQDSFSVTGTVVTSGGNWPASGDSYVMYVRSGSNYYAVAHDGSLHQVSVSGTDLVFPDDADTFELNNYLWTYEEQTSYFPNYRINRFVYYIDLNNSPIIR